MHGLLRKQGTGNLGRFPVHGSYQAASYPGAANARARANLQNFKHAIYSSHGASMAIEQAKDCESIDLVTELQRKLGNLLGLMYSCTGAIQVRSHTTICACIRYSERRCHWGKSLTMTQLLVQRDAPAISVRGEDAQTRSSAPLGDTTAMAQDIAEASQSIDSLLQQLPQAFDAEEVELQRIDALQRERTDVCREVQEACRHAEQALLEVQRVHGSVADEVLAGRETALDHR